MTMTAKKQRFVAEYLVDLNATQAAIRAGYSAKTAKQQGERLLRDLAVAEAVSYLIAARSERVRVDADSVLERLVAEAEADLADLFNDNGTLKPLVEWPLIWRQGLVSGLECETISADERGTGQWRGSRQDLRKGDDDGDLTIVKLKLSDRLKRIELIGKHVGVQAFAKSVEVDVKASLGERLERAAARASKVA